MADDGKKSGKEFQMTHEQMARAFNEWMRRYTEEPERFRAEFQTVAEFLSEMAQGKEPSYGESSAAYMERLSAELAVGS